MVILTLLDPNSETPVRQWRFQNESCIQIGRAPDNQIVLGDRFVSRHHLELRRLDERSSDSWELVNRSTNGTYLAGVSVSQQVLPSNSVIQLAQGGPRLRFQVLDTAATPALPQLPVIVPPIALPAKSLLQSTYPGACTHPGNSPKNLFCIHCGQPVTVEKTVRHYQVLRVLGRGGMGTTYLVWNPIAPSSGRTKGLLQVLKEMNADMAQIPKAQELFEREAAMLKALHHPGIPRFFDFFMEAKKKYLVMELIHGQDLDKRIRDRGPVPLQQAIHWMVETCEVLDYLHSHPVPIIHRDIKPGNLLARSLTSQVVVIDFGAVKAAGILSGTRIGAEGYSAPEQTQGRPLPQSDLYAIGPCLTFLLTGQPPQQFQHTRDRVCRFIADAPEIPSRLRRVIERVTQPRPSDRYRTAIEVSQALLECL